MRPGAFARAPSAARTRCDRLVSRGSPLSVQGRGDSAQPGYCLSLEVVDDVGRRPPARKRSDRLTRVDVRHVVIPCARCCLELFPGGRVRQQIRFAAGPFSGEAIRDGAASNRAGPALVLKTIEDARVDRLCLVACDDRVLGGFRGTTLVCEEKRRPNPSARSAGREHRREPTARGNAARSEDRSVGEVEKQLEERERADRAGMASGLSALRHEKIDTGQEGHTG